MTVLKGELAIKQSIAIMLLFKEMKDYIAAENRQLLGCSNCVQIATLTAQHSHEIAEIRSDVSRLEGALLYTVSMKVFWILLNTMMPRARSAAMKPAL